MEIGKNGRDVVCYLEVQHVPSNCVLIVSRLHFIFTLNLQKKRLTLKENRINYESCPSQDNIIHSMSIESLTYRHYIYNTI